MKREKIRKTVDKLRPIDDLMFSKLAEDRGFCQEVIQTILGKEIEVISVMPQKELRNIKGRSVTVDVLCRNKDNRHFNVEVQKQDNDDHQKRVRYNGSNIDTYISEKGTKFNELPDVYVIYISKFDVFNRRKTCYHIDRTIRETDEVVDNGFHEIYVNTKVKDNSDISELMDIFMSSDVPENNKFPEIKRTISNIKTRRKDDIMCDAVMDLAKEYAEEKSIITAKKLLKKGIELNTVKECTELSDKILLEIQEEIEQEKCVTEA